MKPLIPWPGGKSRLASKLLPMFPTHSCYVEVFAGAAALLLARTEPAKVEVINDINGELVRLYRCVQHHLEELCRQFKWSLVSREMFKWQTLQGSSLDALTEIQRAARFFYLQRCSFSARVEGQSYGYATTAPPGLNLLRIEEHLSEVHLRLARVNIENLDWRECMKRYDRAHTLFFCDPPYWQTQGYGVPFGLPEYEDLAKQMRTCKGKVLLTVNDHPKMREVFAGLTTDTAKINYTMGCKEGSAKAATELIITNW